MLKKEKVQYLGVMILLFFSGLMIFKNVLFFSENTLISSKIEESILTSYSYFDNEYVPTENDAAIYIGGCDVIANEIEIYLDTGLGEDTVISLYNVSSDENSSLIEQKIVRTGFKRIKFYFASMHLDTVKILLQ